MTENTAYDLLKRQTEAAEKTAAQTERMATALERLTQVAEAAFQAVAELGDQAPRRTRLTSRRKDATLIRRP